jgi:hypothetical protein
MKTDLFEQSHAVFTGDRTHRIVLIRRWNLERPKAMVIGLNPSNADEADDDPTIGFVKRVLNHNGYGTLYMVNLFTMVTPYPKDLIRPSLCDYDKRECLKTWKEFAGISDSIVFAWGNFKCFGRDALAIKTFGDRALCFGKNANGSPRHGMYLKPDTKLKRFLDHDKN